MPAVALPDIAPLVGHGIEGALAAAPFARDAFWWLASSIRKAERHLEHLQHLARVEHDGWKPGRTKATTGLIWKPVPVR